MKKVLSLLLVTVLALATVLTGCNGTNNNATEPTQATEKAVVKNSRKMLKEYFASFVEGDSPFYGTWEIEGFDYLSFIFRNDGLAEMVMGTEGNFSSLTIDEKNKTLTTSFIVGLNGDYTYKFSDDDNTLTLSKNGTDTVLHRKENNEFIPKAPKKPVIDKDLLGWWKSKDELVYYFGKDGIMYSNQISIETCYTYNAEYNKITAVYDLGGEVTDSFEYKFNKKGKLVIEGNKYSPYDPFEK